MAHSLSDATTLLLAVENYPVSEGASLKLPGWVRRPPELTPALDLSRARAGSMGPDVATLQDRANDVVYKMIGGAYGVLGAEVLGHLVPRAFDEERWGIYVREAGVAWLCRELAPGLVGDDGAGGLARRMARSLAAHHHVHAAVETVVTRAHGAATYLDLIVKQSPRHGDVEERLAETHFRLEALSVLNGISGRRLEGPLRALMATTPEGGERPEIEAGALVDLLNSELSIGMTATEADFGDSGQSVPCYLVIEPHLPEPVASSIRQALLA